jgi:hypothetical protein
MGPAIESGLPCRVGSSHHNQVKAEALAKMGAFSICFGPPLVPSNL